MTPAINLTALYRARKGGFSVTPMVELGVLAIAVMVAIGSYFVIVNDDASHRLLTAPVVALLLTANLLPGVALLVLLGRRIAHRRAARSAVGGGGQLHVRLVALFSVIAAVPTLLVVIFASLLFQYGVDFWFSDRARHVLENASALARENIQSEVDRVNRETVTMTGDLRFYLQTMPGNSPEFERNFALQLYNRELSEGIMAKIDNDGVLRRIVMINPYDRTDLERLITPQVVSQITDRNQSVVVKSKDRIGIITAVDPASRTYIYSARVFDSKFDMQLRRGEQVIGDYRALLDRSRALQLRFNAALLVISLLIVGIAVWIALQVADRLVRPVNELVDAARRVESGDLTARVATPSADDEVGTLANAFNAMTDRLQQQTGALVAANDQLDSRRALIEAVMSGVTAGVISISADRRVRLINSSAATLLGTTEQEAVSRQLSLVSPELNGLLDQAAREAVVQVTPRGDTRTLAVKITGDDAGQVLTFDDITQQLLDQRRAAWSDVARRIAHEIKNPLTPIQLAAERLQRRYGKQIAATDGTFARLTDTIIRQVGDLRRIVDEFSSFARMPKPMFREESLIDIARQALFLHEIAHGNIAFTLTHDDPPLMLVCDRRQMGQALTNIVKNAVEAIGGRGEDTSGAVAMTVTRGERGTMLIIVEDDGVGLPVERDRIVEPYMTTRARGTGLGLAIVKKIVEEHFGTIAFADREGGGTVVTLCFDCAMLAGLDGAAHDMAEQGDDRLAALTRNRSS